MPETPKNLSKPEASLWTALQLGKALGLIDLCCRHGEVMTVEGLRVCADEVKRLKEKYKLKIDPGQIVNQTIGHMLGLCEAPE